MDKFLGVDFTEMVYPEPQALHRKYTKEYTQVTQFVAPLLLVEDGTGRGFMDPVCIKIPLERLLHPEHGLPDPEYFIQFLQLMECYIKLDLLYNTLNFYFPDEKAFWKFIDRFPWTLK